MFDILLYLYDNYLVMEHIPDAEALSRKLTAAGFEAEEIDQALNWLTALDDLSPGTPAIETDAVRCFAAEEWRRVEADGLAFIAFLEKAGLLTPQGREWVLDRALALEDSEVTAEKIKWIALLAVTRLRGAGDALWLEDLVRGGEDGWQPTLH